MLSSHNLVLSTVLSLGAIHSTKISGNFGPKLNGSVRSNRKSFEKTGPPFEVVLFSRSDRLEFWLNGSRPLSIGRAVMTSHSRCAKDSAILSSSRTSGVGGRVVEEFRSCCCFLGKLFSQCC